MSFPFSLADLKVKEDHQIPVYPANQHWLAAMRDQKSQHPEDSIPVEKLMKCLVMLEDNKDPKQQVWGLKLAKRDCIFVAERKEIERLAAAKNKAITRFYRLVQEIAKKTKKPIPQIQKMMGNMYEHLETLDPWLEQITDALTELNVTDVSVATVTVVIQQRLTRTWTQYDTLALPESLFNKFYSYSRNEEAAWKTEVKEEEEESDLLDQMTLVDEEGEEAGKEIAPTQEKKALPSMTTSDS